MTPAQLIELLKDSEPEMTRDDLLFMASWISSLAPESFEILKSELINMLQ